MKKIAVAIAATLPLLASAATITTTAKTIDDEYLLIATNTAVTDTEFSWSPAIITPAGSLVTFTFSEAPVRAASGFPYPFASAVVLADTTLSLTNQTATSVTYQVTGAQAEVTDTFEIVAAGAAGPDFLTSALSAGEDVTVSAATTTAAGVDLLDPATAVAIVESDDARFTPSVTAGTETIDVQTAAPKTTFIGGGRTATMVFPITNAAASANTTDADVDVITLTGDFSWLDTNTALDGIQVAATSIAVTVAGAAPVVTENVTAIDDGTIALSAPHDDAVTSYTVTLTKPATSTIVIPRQTVTGTFSVRTTAGVELASATGSDVYGINGSTVSIYGVPVTDSVQNLIYLDNSSAASGAVSVSVVDAGETYGPYVLGTVGPDELFDIGGRFLGAVNEAGDVLSGGRVRLDVITEVASSNVAVTAAYKAIAANDRVSLLTSAESDHDSQTDSLIATLQASVDTIDGIVDTINANVTTVDGIVDDILVDTAAIDTVTASTGAEVSIICDNIVTLGADAANGNLTLTACP
jgi:hypothetical protein